MDIYAVAEMTQADRERALMDAGERAAQAMYEVAQFKVGCAIAALRKIKPDAAEIRFRIYKSDGEFTATVHRIDGELADNVLFDLHAPELDDDAVIELQDELVPVEDYLGGAAEAGYAFEWTGSHDERVLRVAR